MKLIEKWVNTSLMLRILAGVVIGSLLAIMCPGISAISMLGELFVGVLKSIAPILVGILVIASVSKARAGVGGRFKTVITLYLVTTLLAAILSVFASIVFPVTIVLGDISGADGAVPGALSDVFRNIVKGVMSNPITALADANYLSILFYG